jgi:uncharacterized protein (DUF1499 family)
MTGTVWAPLGALLGLCLAVLALLLLAMAPLGWRAGWWHFRFAFYGFMAASGFIALAAAAVAVLTLALGWPLLDGARRVMAGTALVLGAVLAYLPYQYYRAAQTAPRIHDISTDTDNPPVLAAVLAAREAEQANPAVYGGPELAEAQRKAYPDLVPLRTSLLPDAAFQQALAAAKSMRGWTIVSAEPAFRRIEASQASRWFRFTDDIVIRISADPVGSRIDMRSASRHGRSDLGVNAARIRAYLAALKRRIE